VPSSMPGVGNNRGRTGRTTVLQRRERRLWVERGHLVAKSQQGAKRVRPAHGLH
jgi:hypothetical protein